MLEKAEWFDEDEQIIMSHHTGQMQLRDMVDAHRAFQKLATPITGRFDIISNLLKTSYTLPIGTLWHWKIGAAQRDEQFPNWGLIVFVTTSDVMEVYFNEGIETSEVIRKHARLAKTVEEAIQIIMADRKNTKSTAK